MTNKYTQYSDRIHHSIINEIIYVINVGKYFGLSHSLLQKLFIQHGSSKFEKRQLKQAFNEMCKDEYYRHFKIEEFNLELIHSTPLYQRLINESLWNDSILIDALTNSSFGQNMSFTDKKIFCCESLTMLLFAFTSLSRIFGNYRLIEFSSIYPHYLTVIFDEASHNQDIFAENTSDPNFICNYQTATAVASIIMNSVRDSWIYDYIIGLSAESIIATTMLPDDENTYIDLDDLTNTDISCVQSIFSCLVQMLSLMLHDKISMQYFGNLPYYMLSSCQTIAQVPMTRLVVENFGKMFWRDLPFITNTESFIKNNSDEFAIQDGKITYIKDDLYNSSVSPSLVLEKWIYAAGNETKFERVYDPLPMCDKLHTSDVNDYIAYTVTDLNTDDSYKHVIKTIIDNYNNASFTINKLLDIPSFSGQFKFTDTVDDLISSKQYKMYENIVEYKLSTELGPNIVLRSIKALDKIQKQIILAKLNYITFLRYNCNLSDAHKILYEEHIKTICVLLNLDINEVSGMIDSLCVDRIKAYTALEYNALLIAACEVYRHIHSVIFIHNVCFNTHSTIIEAIDAVKNQLTKNNTQLTQSLTDTQEKLAMYTDKYKKCKAENTTLKTQLVKKTKDYDKALIAANKITDLEQQIKQLKQENEQLKQEPDRLNQIIAKQKSHINNVELKQTTQDQYEQRIRKLEEELSRQERLWKSVEEDDVVDVELTNEEKYILSHLKLDMTVLECESTKRLQKTIMTNSKFNFIPRAKSETTQVNFSQNADIYLLATDVLSHKDANRWQQALRTKSFRCVYSATNGYQTLCRTILKKYYSMVSQNLITPIEIPDDINSI